ncbi:MAG: hypothetical protein APF84_04590 [Gracilibacter sp. BRH_c7a]|nr:MAG: hypothetical protein APF84_04590 [Gracilibacter sp. BRH_c7a]
MQKKTQKWTVTAIIVIISISLLGSSFVAMFSPSDDPSPEAQRQEALEREYLERQERVQELTKSVEENPGNIETQIELADAYFDKSRVTGQLNYDEYEEDLQKAVELYQGVLNEQEDNDIMLKLATAAFLLGDTELADNTYIELLAAEPQNVDALYGHGLLLFYNKQEYQQAEEKWQEALKITTDEQMKTRLEEMIQVVQGVPKATEQEKQEEN